MEYTNQYFTILKTLAETIWKTIFSSYVHYVQVYDTKVELSVAFCFIFVANTLTDQFAYCCVKEISEATHCDEKTRHIHAVGDIVSRYCIKHDFDTISYTRELIPYDIQLQL